MSGYSQAKQPIRVDTVLEEDTLLLAGFVGREALSQPYLLELDLRSEDAGIDAEGLLRTPLSVGIHMPDGEVRRIHGLVRSFGVRGRRGPLTAYRAEVVPWLWFLSLTRDCRIFQGTSVPDIVQEVFEGHGYSDFSFRLTQDYAPREYCVQYRETDLNFVSRLLEEEGIFYFFEHTEEGHTLVLTDYAQAEACMGPEELRVHGGARPGMDVITELRQDLSVHTGAIALADYDYLKPSLELRSALGDDEPNELYDYHHSQFTELADGDRYARIALEREESTRNAIQGRSTCRGFQTGRKFRLDDHFRSDANQEYLLLEVRHRARSGSFVSGGEPEKLDYQNDFLGIPHGTPYRPPRRARKPVVSGSQTARVVGPSGEKIYVDEYSRVKVHFFWDRLGGEDENSSCWVRVSQNWAGNNWGGMFIPHVGNEVIVDFLDGDPDRPLITGRVYNDEQMPPQSLPANHDKSIIEDDYGNEIVLDATPGDEHIRIYSPSHRSLLEIGKSIKWRSNSDLYEIMKGEKGIVTLGMGLGVSVGFKTSVDLGGSLSLFAGYKFDASLSQKFELSAGPSAKVSAGEEYQWKLSGFSNHVKDSARLHSDDSVLLIGGSGGNSGVMEASKQSLTLQFAPHRPGFEAATQAKAAWAVAISTLIGLGITIGGSVASDIFTFRDGDEGDANANAAYGSLGTMVGLGAIDAGVTAVILAAIKKKARTVNRAKIHGSPHARLTLDSKGFKAEAAIGAPGGAGNIPMNAPMASLALTGMGSANVEAEAEVNVKAPVVILEGDNGMVGIKAPLVAIDAKNIVKIKGNSLVKIG
ncbi:MAG: type VI secretion system tip protein VgrG [Gemmatimonadales bacterium]|nr:MAG: type VI secretion system tip protein VgrG [Gemmatimonadales bacterium]